jgi:hypothetical protein
VTIDPQAASMNNSCLNIYHITADLTALLRRPTQGLTKMWPVIIINFVGILISLPATAEPKATSLSGRWQVDFQRTTNPYGVRKKSVTLDVIIDDGHTFQSQETQLLTDDTTVVESIEAPVDGKFYPITGSPNGISIAITGWAPGFIHMEMRASGGFTGVQTCTLSASSNTMTCDETDTDPQGKKTFSRVVYVRIDG